MAGKVLTGKDIENILVLAQDVISLNTPMSTELDPDIELYDYIEDPSPNPEDEAIMADRKEYLFKVMKKCLTPREREILTMRFGLETESFMTLEEIGSEFKLTRERVRQIEKRALRKLKFYFLQRNLALEDI